MKPVTHNDVSFVFWDWKEQIDIKQLQEAVNKGHSHFYQVNDGSDTYVLCCSPVKISHKKAGQLWDDEMNSCLIPQKGKAISSRVKRQGA